MNFQPPFHATCQAYKVNAFELDSFIKTGWQQRKVHTLVANTNA